MDINLTIFRDVVVACAALVTAISAYYGLSSWKQQLVGKARFNIAIGLLKKTLILFEAIKRSRSPYFDKEETAEVKSDDKTKKVIRALRVRSEILEKLYPEFSDLLPDVYVFLGREFVERCVKVDSLFSEYINALKEYIKEEENGNWYLLEERKVELDKILFDRNKSNNFDKKVLDLYWDIDKELRRYINN
jgi:hypothetical protein